MALFTGGRSVQKTPIFVAAASGKPDRFLPAQQLGSVALTGVDADLPVPALAGDLRPRLALGGAAVLLGGQRDRDQQVVDAPVEPVVGVERHLQHRDAVAGWRARNTGQHLALDALEHPRPAAAARALRLDLQRHVHVDPPRRGVSVRAQGLSGARRR